MTAAQHTPTQRPTAPMCGGEIGEPAGVPTVPAGPDPVRALIDALHLRDARQRESNLAHHEGLRLASEVRAAGGRGAVDRALAIYAEERLDRLGRICGGLAGSSGHGCGAPAVGRTGECQRCAIAAVEGG